MSIRGLKTLVLAFALLLPLDLSADMYLCRDPKTGKETHTNSPTDYKGQKCRLIMRTEPIGRASAPSGQAAPAASGRAPDRWAPPQAPTPAQPTATQPTVASLSAAPSPQAPPAAPPAPPSQKPGRERFDAVITLASRTYDIPEAFIRAVIEVESGYNPRALSRVGAMGMMQLMPGTARDLGVANPWDPEQNIMGGTKLLRWLANRFDGDMVKVLSAYHAGGGVTSQKDGTPYVGTDGYVRKVLKHYHRLKATR